MSLKLELFYSIYYNVKQFDMTHYSKTKNALFATQLLAEPFVACFSLLAFILAKQLNATSLQIGLLTMLRPTVALLSFYWTSQLAHSESCLKRNLMGATALSVLPFLLAPLSASVGYFIFAGAIYQLFSRAQVPALMEILKQNVGADREKLYTRISIATYCLGALLAPFFGKFLDHNPTSWQWLYFFGSSVLLLSLIPQSKITFDHANASKPHENLHKDKLLGPWKNGIQLLKKDRDFRTFEIGFFISGFGLMFAIPAIPLYITHMDVTFTDLFVAMTALKGIGYVSTSHIWSNRLDRNSANRLSMAVFLAFGLFLFVLLFAKFSIATIFIAYFIYGIAQAGSHLVWNLSGVLFSGAQSSSLYSSVNILCVGLRGMIAPPLGGLVSDSFGPSVAISLGALLCIAGAYYIYRNQPRN